MKVASFMQTIRNKAPKLMLILVLLFGLGLNRDHILGYSLHDTQATATQELTEAAQKYFAQNVTLLSDDEIIFDVRDSVDKVIGFVVSSDAFSHEFRGYAGETPVALFLDERYTITGVQMLPNNETGRFAARVSRSGILDSWNGRHVLDSMPAIQAVSGATYTSESVIGNMNAGVAYLSTSKKITNSSNVYQQWEQLIVLLVLVLALLCCFVPRQTKHLRLPVLILSIGVLGIWQGAFVSIDLIYKWALYGTSFTQRWALIAILLVAVCVPLLFSRSFYCNYLCPFGAAQEIIGKLNPHKLAIPEKALRIFRFIRQFFLLAIVVLLFINPHFEASDVEPFTIFTIQSAALSVIIIAILGLIASFFIQRAWCRLLCPTGELLSILQRAIRYQRRKQ